MAKALIIKAESEKDAVQYIGDMLGVYPDEHIFSDDELLLFSVLIINGSVEDVNARLQQMTPIEATAFKWDSDNVYHFYTEIPPEGVDMYDPIEVFNIGIRWYKKTTGFKFPVNLAGLTPEEKQLLETVDINHPAVDSFISKIVKDLASQVGNDVEIKELKNQMP